MLHEFTETSDCLFRTRNPPGSPTQGCSNGSFLSDMVNDAVKLALAEDAEDLAAFEERADERSVDFETVVRSLRRRGKI